jgi:hypothetical protein
MGPKLISCRAVMEQLRPFLPEGTEAEVLEISLHVRPDALQKRIQHAVGAADGLFDPIYLGYGMCSKALLGVVAHKSRLVVPRTDDCIELFLGSREARMRELRAAPGTYFVTQGTVGLGLSSAFPEYDAAVARYGRVKAERLMRVMLRHYTRLAYIRMPGARDLEQDREVARGIASQFGMQAVEIEGTAAWLSRLIATEWDDQFIVAEPGQALERRHFMS